jgi:hypothetical protein
MQETATLFVGQKTDCIAFLQGNASFYVYILRRPDGRPFYVGRGKGARIFEHENEARHPNNRKSNSHKLNVIRSIWKAGETVKYEVVQKFDAESDAYLHEESLISTFLRLHQGGPLTNRAPGGGSVAGASPFTKEKHSTTLGGIPQDDPETAALNNFVLSIGQMRSVILKPKSRFIVRPTQRFPSKTVGPSLRQAVALAATSSANGIELSNGAALPRTVVIDGVRAFVENGVSCDIMTSGMATVVLSADPSDEVYIINETQARVIIGFIGWKKAKDLGILSVEMAKEMGL